MKYYNLDYGTTIYIKGRRYKFLEYSPHEGLLLHNEEGIRRYWSILQLKKENTIDKDDNLVYSK